MAKMKKTVTMADIAERMQVSIVTVSKALSGQKGVSEEVRARIVELAKEMGYRSKAMDRAGEEQKSYRIGVLIPAGPQAAYDSFYWKMYQAVADRAMQKNCFTGYESLTEEMTEHHRLPKLVTDQMVDGLIVIGQPQNDYSRFLKEQAGVPIVLMDYSDSSPDADCVISDGFYGTCFLTKYLIGRGHREFAYVGSIHATESIMDRYLGCLKALMEQGLSLPEDRVIPDRILRDGAMENLTEFALPENLPTAFVCNCDITASLLIRDLQRRGIRVPEDVSVVGFDDYPRSTYAEVGITSYAVDIPAMARETVHILIKRMSGDTARKGIHVIVGHLVEKDSVADVEK